MDPSLLQTLWTAASFVVFVGIVMWAWSRRAARRFEEAERMPFADDAPAIPATRTGRGVAR